jgi:hypothetical protein
MVTCKEIFGFMMPLPLVKNLSITNFKCWGNPLVAQSYLVFCISINFQSYSLWYYGRHQKYQT